MPRPFILRLKQRNISKHNKPKESENTVYFKLLIKFHDNILSIVKSLFVCLFVFAATPIAIFVRSDLKKFKDNISKITSMIGEMMVYCLFLFLLYALFVTFFDFKSRNEKYLTERIKYMTVIMTFLSFALFSIAMIRWLIYFSSLIKSL